MIKWRYCYARVLFAQQNTVKTANQNSRINFYFVTDFYPLYDICMADKIPNSGVTPVCVIFVKRVVSCVQIIHNIAIFV